MSDLAGKNQVVADTVTALMKSETWSAIADTVKDASSGNQLRLKRQVVCWLALYCRVR